MLQNLPAPRARKQKENALTTATATQFDRLSPEALLKLADENQRRIEELEAPQKVLAQRNAERQRVFHAAENLPDGGQQTRDG
jgi:hypothetical protein